MDLSSLTPQEQAVCVKNQLDDEEAKSRKLLQQISKLEEQIATATEESRRKEEVGTSRPHQPSANHLLNLHICQESIDII